MSWIFQGFKLLFGPAIILLTISEINASSLPSTAIMRRHTAQPTPRLNGTVHIIFSPTSINELEEDLNRTVYFNCTYLWNSGNSNELKNSDVNYVLQNATFIARIRSHNGKVTRIQIPPDQVKHDPEEKDNPGPFFTDDLSIKIRLNKRNNFTIEASHIGYVTMSLTVYDSDNLENAHLAQTLGRAEFKVTVTPRAKLADFVFDCSAAAVAILISFGIGCVTDTENLKRQLKYPVSLVIGFCCQFLLMPVLAFGLAMILPLDKNMRFGLLCVACVPGGGLGHVAVIISDADLPLSLTMNLISIVTMLGTAPLWIFVLGQYFQRTEGSKIIPIYNFEIWLASVFFAYTAGLVINRFRPGIADGLLTWLIKPFLLLATILYITLGVYINMYVFEVIENITILAAVLLPLCGFLVGSVLSIIFRQKTNFCKTVALETSSLNCLIVLAALRFSLNQPDANLASVMPIWVMFTIPGIYVVMAILRVVKNSIDGFLESRKNKQNRHYSIASGIVNQANMAALSAPLFVTDTATEDDQASVSEKITVL